MRFFLPAWRRGVSIALAAAVGAAAVAAPAPMPQHDRSTGASAHALENSTFFFRAKDGTVLTFLMLELLASRPGAIHRTEGGGPAYVGAASVEETGRRGEELLGTTAHAVPLEIVPGAANEAAETFFGEVYLQSGRSYAVRYVVQDAARDEIFLKNTLLSVPYLTGGFSVSSIVPAEKYGPAGPSIAGFQVGSEEVVPKLGGVFRRSELLRLYLQVYDARPDPVTLTPRVDVVFRFYRMVKGSSKRQGKPYSIRGAAGASMGLELAIGDWPPGDYRVVVELHDRVAAARITNEGSFSIVAD
jgi:hypothetical protein